MRITINVFAPCLMFDSIIGNRALTDLKTVLVAPVVGFGTVALGLLLGLAFARWTGLSDPAARRTFALSSGIYNYGYIPLPLALFLFDQETVGVLFVHNVGVETAMWSVGLLVLTGHGGKAGWRSIINVPLLAIGLSLILNFSGAASYLPQFVRQTAHLLGQCAIPLGLVLVGATMADYSGEFRVGSAHRMMVTACLLRVGLLPAAFLGLALLAPLTVELRQVVLLQAAMPAAVFPIVMSRHYGGDAATALRVVIATSVVALITLPLWIRLGMAVLNITPAGPPI